MNRFWLFLAISAMGLLIFAGNGSATIIGGPSPVPGFGADDGTELFFPSDTVLNAEIWDIGADIVTFGFFFETDPGTLIPIFGSEDETVGGDMQLARIDFSSGIGIVWDIDDFEVQSIFTNLGTDIGFYLSIGPSTLYTVPSLNPFGLDATATFPRLSDPTTYLIGFEGTIPLAFELVSGITPVPEPSTLLLLGSGLVGLAAVYSRRKRGR